VAEELARPVPDETRDLGSFRLTDESATRKWRIWTDRQSVPIGKAHRSEEGLVFCIAPGEWIELGAGEPPADAVDMTHVRAMFRLNGPGSRTVLEQLCALDLSDSMTPNDAAARTLVAATACELVRDDVDQELSYLLLVSRSFARHLWDRLIEVATR